METFWNGEPTPARRVRVRVGTVPMATWWCHGLTGTVRNAVLVEYGNMHYFLDDEDGHGGWHKVTTGKGAPNVESFHLPDDSEIVNDGEVTLFSDELVSAFAKALAEEFSFIGGGKVEAAPETWERAARGVLWKVHASEINEGPGTPVWIGKVQ